MNDAMWKQLSGRELVRVATDNAKTELEKALIDRLEETLEELESERNRGTF